MTAGKKERRYPSEDQEEVGFGDRLTRFQSLLFAKTQRGEEVI